MKAMILAAGRGERMRPHTDTQPKPLLEAGGRALIEHQIEALVRCRITGIVINHAWLGEQIVERLGDGTRYGARITYSPETERRLETGGGIRKALPMLGAAPFLVVNGDVWTDFPFDSLPTEPQGLAHLVLVPNPPHNPDGDFALQSGPNREADPARLSNQGAPRHTYSGIGVFRPELFSGEDHPVFPLAPLLRAAADRGELGGELYRGAWMDIGTPQNLDALRDRLR